jgi:chromosome segregation ATPase
MARAGIYKSEVVRARDNLLAQGRYPSIDAIRGELGNTGSKGTIHRYLKEIEEEEGGSTGTQVAVSEAIQDLAARLAERLHEEADQRLAALTDKHKAETTGLNDTISALRNEVESFRSQSERQAVELAAEKSDHAETLVKLQEEKVVRAQMAQRILDMEGQQAKEEAHRISLEEKHQHAREALEHFRTAAKEQREQDQRQFEQQIQFLQGELRAAKETVNAKQQELIHSHQDNARLSSEQAHLRSELHRLESEIRPLRAAREHLAVSELKNQQQEERLAQRAARIDELLVENQSYAEKLQDANQAGLRLETELSAAKAVLASHEQILQRITISQAPATKGSGHRKESAENQESLFDPEK